MGNDTDVPTDTKTVTAVNGVTTDVGMQVTLASGALLTLNANGSFSYDPNGAFDYLAVGGTASDGFSYTVSDEDGGSSVGIVSIDINGVNSAPVADAQSVSTAEDTTFNGSLTGSDPEGDSLTFMLVDGADHGSVTVNPDGTFTYTPDADYNGADSFTFKVNDGSLDSSCNGQHHSHRSQRSADRK